MGDADRETGHKTPETEARAESKRARVRRLLIDPLDAIGFRVNAGITLDKHRQTIDRLCDDLAYMSDHGLTALRDMLRPKGGGAKRDRWPVPATVYGYAELVEPRPLEELPGLLRWFRSVEGPRAKAAGVLVETWSYFHRTKRPPVYAARELAKRAADNSSRLELIDERAGLGRASEEDIDWARRYRARLIYCEALVAQDVDDGQQGAAA